jgi:FkbM family methyltransferase|tara:strand:- start:337 stop:1218 length:882 start_codon:yes stop_codon:yes gene_type:complete
MEKVEGLEFIKIHYLYKMIPTLKKIFLSFVKILSPNLSCKLNNLRQRILNRKVLFSYDSKLKLYCVSEDNNKMYFFDKMRGIQTYSYGINYRAVQLIKTYSLELVNFKTNDLVIDCGANYGDLYTWLKSKKIFINYISFEPSPTEYRCIKLNCANQINNNIALSNVEGISEFYLKSDSGDSSIIEPSSGFTNKIEIKTTTLNNYITQKKIENVKLLKLEAEGFEPEILEGSDQILNKIEYIGVDGGPERGKENETTIDYAIKFLTSNGFEVIKSNINQRYAKALFKNTNFKYK